MEFKAHVKSHFTPEDRCPICGIDSKNMAEAKEHMKSHRNIPPTQCTICHNDFPQKGALVRHTRIHFVSFNLVYDNEHYYCNILCLYKRKSFL